MTDIREEELSRLASEYMDFVYAAALRQLNGNAAAAEDVTQAVMLVLIQKSRQNKLREERHMGGWLLKVTKYAVMQAKRAAARRMMHEGIKGRSTVDQSSAENSTAEIRSMIDASLLLLASFDREILVRRYLRSQSIAEVGKSLGIPENSAGRRIARAVDKLRRHLSRRGVTVPATILIAIMVTETTTKAPAKCATILKAAPAAGLAKNIIWRILMGKLQTAAMVGLAASLLVGAGGIVIESANGQQGVQVVAAATTPGKEVAGMQITLGRAAHGVIEITLENTDDKTKVINLGLMLANGTNLIPNHLYLVVSDSLGNTRELHWKPYIIGGRQDDYLIPLMSKGKYDLVLPLDNFVDKTGKSDVKSGETLTVIYQGTPVSSATESFMPELPIWKDKIESVSLNYTK